MSFSLRLIRLWRKREPESRNFSRGVWHTPFLDSRFQGNNDRSTYDFCNEFLIQDTSGTCSILGNDYAKFERRLR